MGLEVAKASGFGKRSLYVLNQILKRTMIVFFPGLNLSPFGFLRFQENAALRPRQGHRLASGA